VLDCEKLAPFDVLWFPYEFPGDPERIPKLFVVAANVPVHRILRCLKPTSRTRSFDLEPVLLKGVVEYRRGDVGCFDADRTIIEPDTYGISYAHILKCEREGQFRVMGRLPPDFRERMAIAVANKPDWRKARKEEYLKWFNPR
jgi:hypothetical protein